MTDPVADLAAEAGILRSYLDQMGQERVPPRETQEALLAAMGLGVGSEAEAAERLADLRARAARRVLPEWLVVEPDVPVALPAGAGFVLETEGGEAIEGRGRALPPLPPGIHTLSLGGEQSVILAAPPTLPAPDRGWGLTAPLWGLRGPERAGLGDFDDLRVAGLAAARHGAEFIGLNPIHAGFPLTPELPSPYSPSHRRRLNPMHVPTGGGASAGPLVDYTTEWPAKRAALRAEYAAFAGSGDFDAFLAAEGADLARFALHQALSERHGPNWPDWPLAAQSPETAPTEGLEDECRFHAWLQWRAHAALTATQRALLDSGMAYGLYLDLAVGTHPAGAETWADRASFARGVSLGAPPDRFSPHGQTWGLAPLDPRALVAGRFRVLAETLRRQLRYSRLLRIDHILGFERAFWVPDESDLPGAYVAMPRDAMLAVTRIEAARAGATVIGEDLGNIPHGLQDALAASGILGCRLVQFERDGDRVRPPEEYAPASLASFGTHDLPTYAGWRAAADIEARAAIGPFEDKEWMLAERRGWAERFADAAGGADADAMHRYLARTASVLVAVQAEDVLGVAEQTNLPGTIGEYPNWRRRLPVPAEGLGNDPRLARVAAIMVENGR